MKFSVNVQSKIGNFRESIIEDRERKKEIEKKNQKGSYIGCQNDIVLPTQGSRVDSDPDLRSVQPTHNPISLLTRLTVNPLT